MANISFHDRKIPTFSITSPKDSSHFWLNIKTDENDIVFHFDTKEEIDQVAYNMKEAANAS